LFFFFQAQHGIRDFHVTGVQTCALPIWVSCKLPSWFQSALRHFLRAPHKSLLLKRLSIPKSSRCHWGLGNQCCQKTFRRQHKVRSEEHTSELQSRENLVCRLLLEKKKK